MNSCTHWLRPRNPFPIPRNWAHVQGRYWSEKIDDIYSICVPLQYKDVDQRETERPVRMGVVYERHQIYLFGRVYHLLIEVGMEGCARANICFCVTVGYRAVGCSALHLY